MCSLMTHYCPVLIKIAKEFTILPDISNVSGNARYFLELSKID